jgi:hypothetical protein
VKNRYFRHFPKNTFLTGNLENQQHLGPNRRRQRAATDTLWAQARFLSLQHPTHGPFAGTYRTDATRERLGTAARITGRAAPFLLAAQPFSGDARQSVRSECQRKYS